jgi:hypothetical protein
MKAIVRVGMNEAIKAGRNEHGERLVEIDVATLTKKEREVLAALETKQWQDGQQYKSFTYFYVRHVAVYPPSIAETTEESIKELMRKTVELYDDAVAEASRREAEKAEREKKEQKEIQRKIEEVRNAYEKSGLDGVREVLRGYREDAWCEKHGLVDIVNALKAEAKEKAKAEEEAKARAAEEKTAWIEAHGSERLKKVHKAGYPCQADYAVERATRELGEDWVVDTHNKMSWRSPKVYPSLESLDIEAELKEKGYEVEIIWLTDDGRERDYDDEPFEPCEAVVIINYLGKYGVVKKMQ